MEEVTAAAVVISLLCSAAHILKNREKSEQFQ